MAQVLQRQRCGGSAHIILWDHQGSITVVANNAGTGQKLNSYDGASGVAEQLHGIPGANNATVAQGGRFAYTG
jgi:hypothetical protein